MALGHQAGTTTATGDGAAAGTAPTASAQPRPHEVVELRVHGVHGTSPGAMLGVADGAVGRVAGDDLTGVYRIEGGDPPLRTLPTPEGVRRPLVSVEAYSWGALTSGVQGFLGWVRRSLWLLLLPFALVNLSYWARTELVRDSLEQRLGAWAVRAAGLLLTVFFVLTPCLVFLDLGAWQCFRYDVPSCDRLPDWTDRLATLTAGQRIAVASLAPMAALLGLWLLSRTTVSRYEDVSALVDPSGCGPGAGRPGHVLRHPRLWRGRDRTRMLARRHLAAGVTTVALFCALHLLLARGRGGELEGAALWTVRAVVGVAAATLLGCLATVLGPHVDDVDGSTPGTTRPWWPWRPLDRGRRRQVTLVVDAVVVGLALASYVATFVLLCIPGIGGSLDQSSAWTGRSAWFVVVFALVTLLHLAVFTGGRMYLVVAFVVVLGVGVAFGWLAWEGDAGRTTRDDVVVIVAAAAAVALLLAGWNWSVGVGSSARARRARARAWNGAGASVLLAAAAWVALLFTSAIVVATANWLNGADHGVGDLVATTKVEVVPKGPDGGKPAGEGDGRLRYAATGDVTASRARVLVAADGRVSITSGDVRAPEVWRPASSGTTQNRVGRTMVPPRGAELYVAPGFLDLDYACVFDERTRPSGESPGKGRCTAEDPDFRGSSRLAIGAGSTDDEPVAVPLASQVELVPSGARQTPLAVPPVLLWMPLAQVFWFVLVLLTVGLAYLVFRVGAGRQLDHFGSEPDRQVPRRDQLRCLGARRRAAFGHRAERLLDVVGIVTSVVALPLVALSVSGGTPWQTGRLPATRELADVGMYLVVGLSALLIGLGSRMRRSESTRKAVGVLWDLTTFWPRAAHPLAPPCYAERVVPELVQRSRWVLDRHPKNRLVLSGHSQGSLIVVATASRLSDEHLGRTRLVTYGSQVRALYGRVFPAVLGPDDVGYTPTPGVTRLREGFPDVPRPTGADGRDAPRLHWTLHPDSLRGRLLARGGSWVNLFRRTDPLGYRVFGDDDGPLGPDWGASADLPVAEVPPDAAGDPGPRVMGHGGYQHTLTYRRVVATWTGEPVVDDPAGTHGVPTQPPG